MKPVLNVLGVFKKVKSASTKKWGQESSKESRSTGRRLWEIANHRRHLTVFGTTQMTVGMTSMLKITPQLVLASGRKIWTTQQIRFPTSLIHQCSRAQNGQLQSTTWELHLIILFQTWTLPSSWNLQSTGTAEPWLIISATSYLTYLSLERTLAIHFDNWSYQYRTQAHLSSIFCWPSLVLILSIKVFRARKSLCTSTIKPFKV